MPINWDEFEPVQSAATDKVDWSEFEPTENNFPAPNALRPKVERPPIVSTTAGGPQLGGFNMRPLTKDDFIPDAESVRQVAADVTGESHPNIPKFEIDPKGSKTAAVLKSAANIPIGVANFIGSPAGGMSSAAGSVGPIAARLLTAGFAGQTVKSAYDQQKELRKDWKDLTPAQKAAGITDLTGTIGFAGLLTKGALKKPAAVSPEKAQTIQEAAPILPRAAQEAAKTVTEQPQPTETPDATQEGKVQESVQPERVGTEAQRVPTETSTGDSVQPEAQKPESPLALTPAIKVADKLFTGSDHVDAYKNAKQNGQPDTSGAQEGFVNPQGQFLTREQAAQKTGLPTETEAGKLHSSDLTEGEKKFTPPSMVQKTFPQWMNEGAQQTRLSNPPPEVAQPTVKGNVTLNVLTMDGPKRVRGKEYLVPGYKGPPLVVAESKSPRGSRSETTYKVYFKDGGSGMIASSDGVMNLNDTLKRAIDKIGGLMKHMNLSTAYEVAHAAAISDAIRGKASVNATAVDAYGLKIPKGYIKEGDLYIYKPESEKPLNPGGALKDLPKELQDKSNAVKDAMRAEFEKLKAQAAQPKPIVDQPVNKTGEQEIVGMGGAIPAEFEPTRGTPTSIKNATVDAERAQRGLPPAIQPLKRSFGAVWDEAMAKIDRNPEAQDQLIEELKDKPRALTDTEDAMLLQRQVDLQNEFNKATRDLAQAYDDGRTDDVQSEKMRVSNLSDQLQEVYDIGKRSGTETARGLNARKMMANEDFSLSNMEMEKRAANQGRPLTDDERTEITQLHDKIAQTQKAYDDYVEQSRQRISELEAQKAVDQIKTNANKTKASDYVIQVAEKIVATLDKRADAARARLREKMGRTSAGVDPTILADLAEIGASHIGHIGLDFAKWSTQMVSDLGEWVRPHLQEAFDASQKHIDDLAQSMAGKKSEAVKRTVKKLDVDEKIENTTKSIKEKLDTGKKDEIAPLAQKLARHLVERGVEDRNSLIDGVHAVLNSIDPSITRRDAMDAISGYGDFKQLRKDEISVRLRGLKGEMQQIGKLEDIQNRQPPLKSGVERRTPTDEERRLIQQVNEAKRRYGINVTDPETQLKSALDARKTYYRNQIKDLEAQIATKERFVKSKSPSPSDAELTSLKSKRDALKADFQKVLEQDETFQKEQDAANFLKQKKRLEDLIAAKQKQIASGEVAPKGSPQNRPLRPELEQAKQELDSLNKKIAEMRNPPRTKEQIALDALKTRLTNSIETLKAKLAAGDFSKAPKREIALDPEATRLKAENEKLKQQYQAGLAKDRLKQRTPWEKTMDTLQKWRRGFILSGPVTLAKLTAAAVARGVITPLEEGVGAGLSKIPGLSKIAERAPREGGASLKAESKAITEGVTQGMKDAWSTLKTGKSDLDYSYGKEKGMPTSFMDIFGNIHGALKAPVKRAEFARSFQKRVEAYARQGVDVTDPFVQTKIAVEAYKDGNRAIFMQRNWLADKVNAFLKARVDPKTGHAPMGQKAFETVGRTLLPIVRVPTNIVAETMQYAVGLATGSAKLAHAFSKGIESVSPEEADLIMRHLKKGSIGSAVMLTGYLAPQVFGGFYQQGEKRSKNDIAPDAARVKGVDIPPYLIHNPLLTSAQLGATIRRVSDSKLRKKDAETQGLSHGALAGALGLAEATPFVRETTEIGKLMNPYDRDQWLGTLGKSLVIPQGVQSVAQFMDKDAQGNEIRRKPETALQFIESGIPGLRTNVPEARARR